ncbi:hypothetical protein [Actinokineospora iranica]|uniref:Uncharacterized protein n=1 Tax=Actinokineospora iranica TaxID=1271860 RepID=A0A1G6TMA0_9PSEU|nr:hypothetical protein [Actinokineospora iranica]SDD29984.1 hypothetical protein SAMN05216174_109208 [Actinokineospora iranica]
MPTMSMTISVRTVGVYFVSWRGSDEWLPPGDVLIADIGRAEKHWLDNADVLVSSVEEQDMTGAVIRAALSYVVRLCPLASRFVSAADA